MIVQTVTLRYGLHSSDSTVNVKFKAKQRKRSCKLKSEGAPKKEVTRENRKSSQERTR